MFVRLTLITTALVLATTASAGSLTGKTSFTGKAPKADPIKMNADPVCAKQTEGSTEECCGAETSTARSSEPLTGSAHDNYPA